MIRDEKLASSFVEAVAKVAGKTGQSIDAATMAMTLQVIGAAPPPQNGFNNQQGAGGVYNRLAAAVRYVVSGVGPQNWMGPWQPIMPIADKPEQATIGRMFDYDVGQNLKSLPRAEEAISFSMLRKMGENYDLMRLAIETVKDQIESCEWKIVPIDVTDLSDEAKAETLRLSEFWEKPDKEHDWGQWIRMVVEDMLVLDAIAIFPTKTRGGDMYSLDLVDPSTIKRVIDAYGRTPLPPDPAYQQVLKGIAAIDYTREDLIYTMRNPRTWKLYGYGPVEQVITTVNIAIRRQLHQLQFYTEGTVPEAIVSLPDGWTSVQIKEFQDWFDGMMTGNTAARRKVTFLPEHKGITFPKDGIIKDDYDEWLARIICWAFSLSPVALVKGVNRAASEQQSETAKEEGQRPRLNFIARLINSLNKSRLGAKKCKFVWSAIEALDPLEQAKTSQIYVTAKVITPDEVRKDLGRAPMTDEQRETAWPTPPAPPGMGDGDTPGDGEPGNKPNAPVGGGKGSAASGAAPAKPATPKPPTHGHTTITTTIKPGSTEQPVGKSLQSVIQKGKKRAVVTNVARAVAKGQSKVASSIRAAFVKKGGAVTHHAAILVHTSGLLKKIAKAEPAESDDIEEKIQAIVDQLNIEGISQDVIDTLLPEIEDYYRAGGEIGMAQVNFKADEEITNHMDKAALEYAETRSAELVTDITETTREAMQNMIADAIEQGMSTDDLADYLQEGFAFSESRAQMIARTELADAHVQGNLQGWRESGVVQGKKWILGDNHPTYDECDECADMDPVDLEESFQAASGTIFAPPAHPNCVCDIVPVLISQEDDEEEK